MTQPLNPVTLPTNDNVNPYAFCVELGPDWFIQKGAMIAYYGNLQFHALNTYGSVAAFVATQFSSPLYAQDWVIAQGQGKLVLGDRGYEINSYDVEAGNLSIRAANLLAFQPTLQLKQSIVPGFVTLLGTGKMLASSNGPVMFAEPPIRADPQALVGWADCPTPSVHFDAKWMEGFLNAALGAFGRHSGEERQYDFTGSGTVILQSSEAVREDSALLRMMMTQAEVLSIAQMGVLGRTLTQRAAQNSN